ncbi:MAG: hypothetical protein LBB22_01025, partial [Treponema sp.]|nr:hypothetical protein [Treponema sp.]
MIGSKYYRLCIVAPALVLNVYPILLYSWEIRPLLAIYKRFVELFPEYSFFNAKSLYSLLKNHFNFTLFPVLTDETINFLKLNSDILTSKQTRVGLSMFDVCFKYVEPKSIRVLIRREFKARGLPPYEYFRVKSKYSLTSDEIEFLRVAVKAEGASVLLKR